MDMMVARSEIEFSKVLGTAQFIQEVINERNEKLVFDGEFIEGTKFWTQRPITFFLEYHDHRRRIGDGTRTKSIHFNQFLHNFLNFILLGKGMMIRANIGRETTKDKWNGMIINTTRRGKSLGSAKNNLVFGYERLDVNMHIRCIKCLNRMELDDNNLMTFF
jgi:hypothetical protein